MAIKELFIVWSVIRFIIENKDEEYCQGVIKEGLSVFVEHQIVLQFPDAKDIPVHFVGSIGFYLQSELKEVLSSFGLTAGKILKRPIDGLVAHHKEHILVK